MQEPQTRVHHAEPLVMAREVLALLAADLAEPLFPLRIVDIVIVHPTFLARVVRRIDVDALDLALVARQQRLKRSKIVAVDDHVLRRRRRAMPPLALQHTERHLVVVVDHLVFPSPFQHRHVRASLRKQSPRNQGGKQHVWFHVPFYAFRFGFTFAFGTWSTMSPILQFMDSQMRSRIPTPTGSPFDIFANVAGETPVASRRSARVMSRSISSFQSFL